MIVMYALDPTMLYVRADSQFQTFQQLIDYAKANPGKLQFGLPNPTAMDRWVVEQLKKKIDGFDVNAVSFEGGGDVMLNVLNGTIDAANGEPSELGDQITAGKLRPLAVWTEERLDIMPELPTAKEQGVDLVVNKFRGVAGPKGLPNEVHEAWLKGIQLATEKPDFKAWLDAGGVNITFKDHEEYTKFMQSLAEEQAAFFAEIGLTN
jgi:tripartite-type tricarboxylate transporter receptor subunit TctC